MSMKNKIYFMIVSIILSSQITLTKYVNNSNNANGKNYIANLTGRTVILNFYAKNLLTKKTTWFDAKTFGPLLIKGKSPANTVDTLTSTLLPPPIDMHAATCYKIRINAFKINSHKLKDKKIKGCTIPTPSVAFIPRDYKITLQGDQIVVKEMNTRSGIPIPGLKKSSMRQWPSEKELLILKMTPEEKIAYYKQAIEGLHNDIKELTNKIQRMHDKNGNIKPGKLTQVNNRHKMITNKKEKIKSYSSRIDNLNKNLAKSKEKNANTIDNADTIDQETDEDLDSQENELQEDTDMIDETIITE